MAVRDWNDDTATGYGDPTVTDLSDMAAPYGLNGGESMAGGNVLTGTPAFGAAGSPSEQTSSDDEMDGNS